MGLRLIDLISDFKSISINDGIMSKEELLEMLKLDVEVPQEYKNEEGYIFIADKILDNSGCNSNRVENNKRRMNLYLQGFTLKEIAKAEKKTKQAMRYWYKINGLSFN